jgi:hypothetical protein
MKLMHPEKKLISFLIAARHDGRISAIHISLYLALIQKSLGSGSDELTVFRKEIMLLAKVSSRQTYTKRIRELQEFGYIIYSPSFHQTSGTLIQFL